MEQPMQMLAYSTLAVALADAMVRARFSLRFGIHSHAEYLEFILRRSMTCPPDRPSV